MNTCAGTYIGLDLNFQFNSLNKPFTVLAYLWCFPVPSTSSGKFAHQGWSTSWNRVACGLRACVAWLHTIKLMQLPTTYIKTHPPHLQNTLPHFLAAWHDVWQILAAMYHCRMWLSWNSKAFVPASLATRVSKSTLHHFNDTQLWRSSTIGSGCPWCCWSQKTSRKSGKGAWKSNIFQNSFPKKMGIFVHWYVWAITKCKWAVGNLTMLTWT